jgi:hypothetical protein
MKKVKSKKTLAYYLGERPEDPDFYYHTELIENMDPEKYGIFKQQLLDHANYEQLKDRFIFKDEFHVIIYIIAMVPKHEVADLSDEERRYYPICSKEEIRRMGDVKNNDDNLLLLRANAVAHDPTLQRICFRAMSHYQENWDFTRYFNSGAFKRYLGYLKKDRKAVCKNLTAGFYLVNEANGSSIPTEYGPIVTISYHLKQFFYYMNVWEFGGNWDIAQTDCLHALFLALRTMMGWETPDFELDPRGRLPKSVHRQLTAITDEQLQVIIGHEYAHCYLGHLAGKTNGMAEMLNAVAGSVIYPADHQQEFDADYHAIAETDLNQEDLKRMFYNACTVLLYFDLYECVRSYVKPRVGAYSSHPKALDRLSHLLERFPAQAAQVGEQIAVSIRRNEELKHTLVNDYMGFNIELLEQDGSVYLPSHRHKNMIDRLDF